MEITTLTVASRKSPLAVAQVEEVLKELNAHHPHIQFSCAFVETTGDKDQKTSLRSLHKTNFFTKEIDEMLLNGFCRIAIHSAKDLPDPIPQGLSIAAITAGVDSSDSIVLKQGIHLSDLPPRPLIATSSAKREECVKALIPHASFIDIRGTINERLKTLDNHQIDGVVVAEAALIRLGLTHLNRIKLPGRTTPFQGQLAIVIRIEDREMGDLFACLESRGNL